MNAQPATPFAAPLQIRSASIVMLMIAGGAALACLFWGFHVDPERVFHSYLTAFAFVLSLVVGCIGFVMISHAANATWPVALRRIPEAVAATMPAVSLLFVPLLFGLRSLYPWAHASDYTGHLRAVLEHRHSFMNPGFFALRAGCYLFLWSFIAWRLRSTSLALEREDDPERCAQRLRRLSYAGLPLLTLTSGFAGFEWFMSLSPDFSSTMFGALWIALCLFGGVACSVLLCGLSQRRRMLAIGPAHYSALGRLLFAFLFFLAYVSFFQFLLCWMGNLPSEAHWYVQRARGIYWYGSVFLIVGHFGLPFLALLSYRLKRRIGPLTWIACWCLASQYLHIHWLITPNAKVSGFSWFDLVALFAVLGPTIGVGLWLQRGKPWAALRDPRYAASFAYQSR